MFVMHTQTDTAMVIKWASTVVKNPAKKTYLPQQLRASSTTEKPRRPLRRVLLMVLMTALILAKLELEGSFLLLPPWNGGM